MDISSPCTTPTRPTIPPGRAVAATLDQVDFLERLVTLVDERFELGVWQRVGG